MKKFFRQPLPEALLQQMLSSGQALARYDLNCTQTIKSAASKLFTRERINGLKPPDDHFGVHNVIMGSEERYGDNNNGDAFPWMTMQRDHPTFVKYGHVYREHRHKKDDPKLGRVVACDVDPETERMEVYSWVSKSAAEQEYEEAKAGKQHTFSMSCAIPYDECSACGHKAKTPKDWCSDLALNMRRFNKRANCYNYARNTHIKLFDNSFVRVPAEPTAFALETDLNHIKAASADNLIRSYDAAQDIYVPDWMDRQTIKLSSAVAPYRDLLVKMAAAEKRINECWQGGAPDALVEHVLAYGRRGNLPNELRTKMASLQEGTMMRKMAKRGMILPFHDFIALITNSTLDEVRNDAAVKSAECCLCSIFEDLMGEGGEQEIDDVIPGAFAMGGAAGERLDPGCRDEIDNMMDHASKMFSCRYSDFVKNAQAIRAAEDDCVRKPHSTEGVTPEGRYLSRLYGTYKLAQVQGISELTSDTDELTPLLAVAAHYPFN